MQYEYFKNGMIGHFPPTSEEFYFSGEQADYEKALLTYPDDWIYRTKKITYQYNSHGHRSIEIDELPKDYILFTGCSHTEGHGLAIEDTYASVISNKLGMKYYNLALKGSGCDTLFYNLALFLAKAPNKPKYVITQWPEPARMGLAHSSAYHTYYPSQDHGYAYDYSVYTNLLKHNVPENHAAFYRKLALQCLQSMNIVPYEFFIGDPIRWAEIDIDVYNENYAFHHGPGSHECLDVARDLIHVGIETNLVWADSILKLMEK